jgi:hypothetical protein
LEAKSSWHPRVHSSLFSRAISASLDLLVLSWVLNFPFDSIHFAV